MIEKKLSNATPLDDENVVLRRSDNNFLNKTQITNCILSAPNGVATCSGNTITVKQGLKVLIPNGRNADKTLNNIEYTLTDEVIRNLATGLSDRSCFLFLDSEYNILYTPKTENVFYGLKSNISLVSTTYQAFYYAEDENLWYMKDTHASDWNVIFCFLIGTGKVVDKQVISLFTYQPVELAKQQDLDGMWTNSEKALLHGVSVTNTSGVAIDVSDYLPNDGNIYEVLCRAGLSLPANSTAGYRDLIVYSDIDFGSLALGYTATAAIPNYNVTAQCNNFILPVGTGRKILYYRTAGFSAEMRATLAVIGYRKVR